MADDLDFDDIILVFPPESGLKPLYVMYRSSRNMPGTVSGKGQNVGNNWMGGASTGDDMENIRMELEKLISYTMGSDVVTTEDMEAVTTVQVTNKIFDMVNAIVTRKTRLAMDLYEDLLTLKEPPMRILFLIARQFNQLLLVKEMTAKGTDRGTIASKLKIPPFVAGKVSAQAGAFTREQILSYVKGCVEAEEAVKTGKMNDRMAVELLITRKY